MRSLGIKDIQEKMVGDESTLFRDLKDIDLKAPKNNWERHLKEAKEKGYSQVFLKLSSQAPLFRVKYQIYFDENKESQELTDALFLRYIIPNYFNLESQDPGLCSRVDWEDNHEIGINFEGKPVLTGKTYIVSKVPKAFSEYLDVEIFGLKVEIKGSKGFDIGVKVSPLNKDKEIYTVRDLFGNENDDPYHLLIAPDSDIPYKTLIDIFK